VPWLGEAENLYKLSIFCVFWRKNLPTGKSRDHPRDPFSWIIIQKIELTIEQFEYELSPK
jgi:hypothetical protein